MQVLLADLALENEAATVLALRLARAVDERADPVARALVRVGTPAAKLWVCKRAIAALGECMEVLGGNGYVEEAPLARLYREAPVNSIWEDSGNVMALDVLRGLAREAERCRACATSWTARAAWCPRTTRRWTTGWRWWRSRTRSRRPWRAAWPPGWPRSGRLPC